MPSPLVYFQIATADIEAARAFYGALFDRKFGEPAGRVAPIDAQGPGDFDVTGSLLRIRDGAMPFATPWFRVDDLWARFDRALALGAQVMVPIRQGGAEGPHSCLLRSPDGQTFGVVQA